MPFECPKSRRKLPARNLLASASHLLAFAHVFAAGRSGDLMNRTRLTYLVVAALTTLFVQPMAVSQAASSTGAPAQQIEETPWSFGQIPGGSPFIKGNHQGVYLPTRNGAALAKTSTAAGVGSITYHAKGRIIANPNVYVIWYGDWKANSCSAPTGKDSTPSIINDFLLNLGGSPWNDINTTYYQVDNGKKTYVASTVNNSGCAVDSESLGSSLDSTGGAQVSDVVKHALSADLLPIDPNAVYVVITSADVSVAGFLTQFCAYHSSSVIGTTTIKYAFAGDASANLAQCAPQLSVSPNNNPAADALASVVAHEFVEAVSDPTGVTWFDRAGYENADKCAWVYGTAKKAANGSFSNMTLGSRQYLIQQNVAANTNTCVSSS